MILGSSFRGDVWQRHLLKNFLLHVAILREVAGCLFGFHVGISSHFEEQ